MLGHCFSISDMFCFVKFETLNPMSGTSVSTSPDFSTMSFVKLKPAELPLIELGDERSYLLAGVEILPLVGSHREQQVRVRQLCPATVHPDEDVEHLVRILRLLQEGIDQPEPPGLPGTAGRAR